MNNDKKITFKKTLSGFKYIKTEPLKTLLPINFLKNNEDCLIDADLPIFFQISTNKFCYFLCNEFTESLKLEELNISRQCLHTSDGIQRLYFAFDSLTSLKDSLVTEGSSFLKFKESYDSYRLDVTKGEKVIVMCFKNTQSDDLFNNTFSNLYKLKNSTISSNSNSKFEYFKAYKFNNRYYLMDGNEKIDQSSFFILNRKNELNSNYLVVEYSENNLLLAARIVEKMKSYKDMLNQFFTVSQKPELAFDEPLHLNKELLSSNLTKKLK